MKVTLFGNNYGNSKFHCPQSESKTIKLSEELSKNNIERGTSLEDTDIMIYIGCAALGTSLDKYIQDMKTIINYSKTIKDIDIIVAGCITKIDGYNKVLENMGVKIIKDSDYITPIMNYLMNKNDKSTISKLIKNNIQSYSKDNNVFLSASIEEGCINRCSFCKNNYLNNKVKSLPYKELLKELRNQIKNGCRVLDLHGENLTLYGLDLERKPILHRLLHDLSKEEDLLKIYLGEIAVTNMYDELLTEIINNKKIPYISLQLETASNRLLELMNRKHTIEEYDQILKNLKSANRVIHTVIMTGFPTETYEDIDKTIDYIDKNNLLVEGTCNYIDCKYLPSHDLSQLSKKDKKNHKKYFLDKSSTIRNRIMNDNIANMSDSIIFRKENDFVVSTGPSYTFCVSKKHNDLNLGDVIEEKPKTFIKHSKYLDGPGYKF